MKLFNIPHGEEPCTSCMLLMSAQHDQLAPEMVLPVPEGAFAPLSRTQRVRGESMRTCFDCAAAEGMMALLQGNAKRTKGGGKMTFPMARLAVGNDRREMLRLPGIRLGAGVSRPSAVGDLDTLCDWHNRTIGNEEARATVRRDMELERK